jgi:preprotein translocase subunit YajC
MIVIIITILALAAVTYRQQRNAARRLAADRKQQLDRFRSHLAGGDTVRLDTGEKAVIDWVGRDVVTVYTEKAEYKHLRKEQVLPLILN